LNFMYVKLTSNYDITGTNLSMVLLDLLDQYKTVRERLMLVRELDRGLAF
jgi:hypothetical protein